MSRRWLSWMLAGVFSAGSLAVAPMAAQASTKGRKNTAIGLTGVAAHQLLKGKTKTGIIAGAGAAYAWKRHRDARKAERRRERVARYRSSSYRTASNTSRHGRSKHRHSHYRNGRRVVTHSHWHGAGHHR